jgi:RNA polymerase-binding transcription factor DksA
MDVSSREAVLLLQSRRHALQRVESGVEALQLQGDAERELAEIDAALARIDAGSYGSCERCGGAIGRSRLRALPEIRFCASCAVA